MNKIITFIILAYNVEQYLDKCLNSFLCPSVMDKIEVIIVNDGSTDSTAQIADCYASKYPEVFRVIHKQNGGHGSGINAGSEQARGKYLKPIDADDWVITENLPEFVQQLADCDAQVALTPYHTVDMTTGNKTAKLIKNWDSRYVTVKNIIDNWAVFEDCCVFHSITYKTDFYKDSGHKLPEHIFYEDQVFDAIPFCKAEKIAVFDTYVYQYLVGNAQQSVSYDNQAKRADHVEKVAWDIVDYYKTASGLSDGAKDYLMLRIQMVALIYLATVLIYEKNKKKGRRLGKAFCDKLKEQLPQIYQRIGKKYMAYRLMNHAHISAGRYQALINAKWYKKMKK